MRWRLSSALCYLNAGCGEDGRSSINRKGQWEMAKKIKRVDPALKKTQALTDTDKLFLETLRKRWDDKRGIVSDAVAEWRRGLAKTPKR